MKVKLVDIKVPEGRIRKEFDPNKLEELAISIESGLQIEPILLNQDMTLIAGERRVRAHELRGWKEIEARITDNLLEPWLCKKLELEENLCRVNITFEEEARGIRDFHLLHQEKFGKSVKGREGGWTIDDTANLLSKSHGLVVESIQLADGIDKDPTLAKRDSREVALKAIKMREVNTIKSIIANALASTIEANNEDPIQIILGDSREVLKKFEDETFDFCITDPPYSIGAHDLQDTFPNRGEVRQGIEFDDSSDVLDVMVRPVMEEVWRLLKDDSHCYIFFAIARYTEVRKILEEIGFWVNPCPLLWVKNNALNLDPWRRFPVNYEPIFHCCKKWPPRPFTSIQKLSTFDYPIMSGMKKVHPTEKPINLIKQLIEICSQEKERGIDPFNGGGTFTRALKEMERLGVGVEVDRDWWMMGKGRLEED